MGLSRWPQPPRELETCGKGKPCGEKLWSSTSSQNLSPSVCMGSPASLHVQLVCAIHPTRGRRELFLPNWTHIPDPRNCEQRASWEFGASNSRCGSFNSHVNLLRLSNIISWGFKQQKFTSSQFWGLEVQDQGAAGAGFGWDLSSWLADGHPFPHSPLTSPMCAEFSGSLPLWHQSHWIWFHPYYFI